MIREKDRNRNLKRNRKISDLLKFPPTPTAAPLPLPGENGTTVPASVYERPSKTPTKLGEGGLGDLSGKPVLSLIK